MVEMVYVFFATAVAILGLGLYADRPAGQPLSRFIPEWAWLLAAPVAVGLLLAFARVALSTP